MTHEDGAKYYPPRSNKESIDVLDLVKYATNKWLRRYRNTTGQQVIADKKKCMRNSQSVELRYTLFVEIRFIDDFTINFILIMHHIK